MISKTRQTSQFKLQKRCRTMSPQELGLHQVLTMDWTSPYWQAGVQWWMLVGALQKGEQSVCHTAASWTSLMLKTYAIITSPKNTKRILKHVLILLTSRILLLVGSVVHLPAGECVTGLFIWPQLRHAVMLYTPPSLTNPSAKSCEFLLFTLDLHVKSVSIVYSSYPTSS